MLEHGGNLGKAAVFYGIPVEQWLDLSTGINPQGYPVADIPSSLWQRLPLEHDGLLEAAHDYYQARNILPTAGSQAAIQSLPRLRPPSRVRILGPTYAEHERAWQQSGHHVEMLTGEDLPLAVLSDAIDVLVVCNPNNPTGRLINTKTLLVWHHQLAERGGWLIVDEAFMDSTPEYSLAQHTHLPGLIVLRSLGKFFGLAGARVGFVLAENSLLEQLNEQLGPWAINGASRWIAIQALMDKAWQSTTCEHLNQSSLRLQNLLRRYELIPHGGTALFQWVISEHAQRWQQHLARYGVWVRYFDASYSSANLHSFSSLRFGLPGIALPNPDDTIKSNWERLETILSRFSI
jgi:cobalamin biosynthetic protein CobC